jgi:hypothetical protein
MLSPHEMETMLRNVDRRTTRLEQILPTLATKEDLSASTARLEARIEAVRDDTRILAEHLLATKEEIRTLPTREELREGLAEARRHAVILNGDVRGDVRMLAGHLAGVIERGFRKQ